MGSQLGRASSEATMVTRVLRGGKRRSVTASGMTLVDTLGPDCGFCMQTHKPGLCKGQKRGTTEPGVQDATKKTPVQVAQTAVSGLNTAIAQAQAVANANPSNPKLAAMARKAISGYKAALRPHQAKLKDAKRENDQAKRTGDQDTRQQDTLDRREARHKDTLKRRAARIIARRNEQAKLAKMSPKQRAAYHKAKSAAAKKEREKQENKTLKDAAR